MQQAEAAIFYSWRDVLPFLTADKALELKLELIDRAGYGGNSYHAALEAIASGDSCPSFSRLP